MKIIKFTALWCADCIVMRPMWEEVKREFPGLLIEEYDFDEQPELAARLGVSRVPCTIFYDRQGGELLRLDGMSSRKELLDQVGRLASLNENHEKD